MSKCKGCGAEIEWIHTIGGAVMPVDPLLQIVGMTNKSERLVLVTPAGRTVKNPPYDTQGYAPHWATCSRAKDFKK